MRRGEREHDGDLARTCCPVLMRQKSTDNDDIARLQQVHVHMHRHH